MMMMIIIIGMHMGIYSSLQYEDDYDFDGNVGAYYHNWMSFTTYDRDNDAQSNSNCAAGCGGGWWYNSCYFACLTCKADSNGWYTMLDPDVVNSRMMIKPQ